MRASHAAVRTTKPTSGAPCHPFGPCVTWRDCPGLGAIHPRKSTEGSVDDSISGSAAFRNVTRAAHHIYRDPEDETEDLRLLFTSKSNYLARRPVTLRFRIRPWDEDIPGPCQCPVDSCEHEGRVVWEDDLTDSRMAEQIWQQIAARNKPRNDVAVQEAEEFLYRVLDQGRQPPEVVFALAKPERITPSALKRAKENLHVLSVKEGFPARVVAWELQEGEDVNPRPAPRGEQWGDGSVFWASLNSSSKCLRNSQRS